MGPSNLSQVFVVNNVTMLTGTTFNQSAATANASKFGIWNIDSAVGPIAAGTYTATDITALRRIQFTQSTLGNVISSPIIDVANIVRINYNGFAADVQTHPIQTWNPASGTALPVPATKNVMVRIALRTAPTSYESYANPSNLNLDVVGTTGLPAAAKVFPLVGNFAAGRMIFNIEIPVSAATTHANACDFVKAAILADPKLSSIFSYNATGAATLALTARHQGVEFDMVVQYSDGSGAPGLVSGTRLTPTTNYTQAISAEKAQRARYGNFNRMYFPVAQVDYAQPTYAYDMLEIQYKHDHPASTGIARPGEINTLKVFFGSSATPLAAAADFAAAFSIAIATDEEQATDVVLQPNV